MMCARSSTISSLPRSPRIASAIWLPIVAVGRYDRFLLAEQRCGAAFELADGRVLALLLVADNRVRHRLAHACDGLRLRVGAEIDHRCLTLR